MAYDRQKRVQLTEMREYISGRGAHYFAGYMGGVRLVLMKNERAECTGREVGRWQLFVEEAAPPNGASRATNGAGGPPPQSRAASAPARRPMSKAQARSSAQDRRAAAMLRERGIDPAAPMRDDDIPL